MENENMVIEEVAEDAVEAVIEDSGISTLSKVVTVAGVALAIYGGVTLVKKGVEAFGKFVQAKMGKKTIEAECEESNEAEDYTCENPDPMESEE